MLDGKRRGAAGHGYSCNLWQRGRPPCNAAAAGRWQDSIDREINRWGGAEGMGADMAGVGGPHVVGAYDPEVSLGGPTLAG